MSIEAKARAWESQGVSGSAVHRAVVAAMNEFALPENPALVDLGCGRGLLGRALGERFDRHLGVDIVQHPEWPASAPFQEADLSNGELPLPDATADVVAALGLIEYLENPRALLRGVARVLKPGGWLVLSTPNHRSLRSLMCLLWRGQFAALSVGERPMVSALLLADLRRAATDAGMEIVRFRHVEADRLPRLPWRWPEHRWFDTAATRCTLLMVARRPISAPGE